MQSLFPRTKADKNGVVTGLNDVQGVKRLPNCNVQERGRTQGGAE
jgi:hypothetical protein